MPNSYIFLCGKGGCYAFILNPNFYALCHTQIQLGRSLNRIPHLKFKENVPSYLWSIFQESVPSFPSAALSSWHFKMDFILFLSSCSCGVTTKMSSAVKVHFLHRCGCLDFLGQERTMRFNHFGNEWGRKVSISIAGKDSCQLKSQSRSVKNQLKLPYQVFP